MLRSLTKAWPMLKIELHSDIEPVIRFEKKETGLLFMLHHELLIKGNSASTEYLLQASAKLALSRHNMLGTEESKKDRTSLDFLIGDIEKTLKERLASPTPDLSKPREPFKQEQPTRSEKSSVLCLRKEWLRIRQTYFPSRSDIDDYDLLWAKRKQTRCLASCDYVKRKVTVAKQMAEPEARTYLEPLLYHEMCHAIIGVPPEKNGRRQIHGRDFKKLERRHPQIQALDAWINSGGWQRVTRKFYSQNFNQENRKVRESKPKRIIEGEQSTERPSERRKIRIRHELLPSLSLSRFLRG